MTKVADPTFFGLIHDYLKVYLPIQRGCSTHTIRSYRTALDAFLDFVKSVNGVELPEVTFRMITAETLSAYLESIEQNGNSASTRNHRLAGIRAFFDYAAKINTQTVIHLAEIHKVPVKNAIKPETVQYMNEASVKALLQAPDPLTKKGLRDRFILLLMYDSAARVQELLKIRLCDIKRGNTPTATLFGKGSKIRTVPLMGQTMEYFELYKSHFHSGEDEYSEKCLFYSVTHGDWHPMNDSTIRRIVYACGISAREKCADVPANIHPHMLRHSRAMHLYQHGMDLSLISQWLGHAHIETTLIYAYADTEQKRKAIETAVPKGNPLRQNLNADRYTVTDDDTLKHLYGLR
jgi:site-specific recombinase XerD